MENHGDLRYLKAESKTREAEPKPAAPAAPAAEPCTAPFALRPSVGTWHLSCANRIPTGYPPNFGSWNVMECWIIGLIGLLGVWDLSDERDRDHHPSTNMIRLNFDPRHRFVGTGTAI